MHYSTTKYKLMISNHFPVTGGNINLTDRQNTTLKFIYGDGGRLLISDDHCEILFNSQYS
jgi:hypothetical protein